MRPIRISTLILIIALSMTNCSTSFAAKSANPYGAAAIDPPAANEVILTLSSKNAMKRYRFEDLLKFKSSTLTIHEPFVKKNQSFTVIPLKTLFTAVGIAGSDTVQTKALNDYIYSNSAKAFLAAGGYLAIKRDGQAIPYDQGGPIRIIFPNTSKWSIFLDPWNWSLMSISVK
jgi:hypothetical protein